MPLHASIKIISQYKYTLFEDMCNTQEHYFLMKSIKLQDSFYKYYQNKERTQPIKRKRRDEDWVKQNRNREKQQTEKEIKIRP